MMITKLSQTDLIANIEALAAKATGRAVMVRIMKLPGRAVGLAQKGLVGEAVIDLDPANLRDVRLFINTLTHELAHVIKHYYQMPRRNINKSVDLEVSRQALHMKLKAPTVTREESEAEALAARMREVIKAEYWSYMQSVKDPALTVLKILYHQIDWRIIK